MAAVFVGDPDDVLDFAIDWTDWLAEGETIATAEWVLPDALTLEDEADTDVLHTCWLSGGTAGVRYTVTSRVTTSEGRTADQSFRLVMRER